MYADKNETTAETVHCGWSLGIVVIGREDGSIGVTLRERVRRRRSIPSISPQFSTWSTSTDRNNCVQTAAQVN